jgi:hypothetical protein
MPEPSSVDTEKIAVFLDFQNVHLIGHDLYARGSELDQCVPDPTRMADLIAERRSRPSTAARIGVYRGRPSPQRQPVPTAANDAQMAHWTRDRRVQVIRRQLDYRGWPNVPPQEKGISVRLGVDLISTAFTGRYDALVLFSSDTDLLPVLEAVAGDKLGNVEVACWLGSKPLRFPGSLLPWCHHLNEADWTAVTEDWQGRAYSS